jgi:hypothetical protein
MRGHHSSPERINYIKGERGILIGANTFIFAGSDIASKGIDAWILISYHGARGHQPI